MCKKSRESIDHLMLHHEVARMGFGFPFFGDRVGHTPKGGEAIGWLERIVWKPL